MFIYYIASSFPVISLWLFFLNERMSESSSHQEVVGVSPPGSPQMAIVLQDLMIWKKTNLSHIPRSLGGDDMGLIFLINHK